MSDPERLRPGETRQTRTERAAQTFAQLAQSLRDHGHAPQEVAHFVNRLVFCMFAEDVGLLPGAMFTRMLEHARGQPEEFATLARDLFGAMSAGGRVGFETVEWFNGGLFEDDATLPMDKAQIETTLEASELDWSNIDPSILGTLFERGLDPDKRSQLGAHYTDRDKIMRIIDPVVVPPAAWRVGDRDSWDRQQPRARERSEIKGCGHAAREQAEESLGSHPESAGQGVISFERLLAGDDLRHVTLLSYTASLSHFEYAILPNLRTTDAGAISLVVDRGEYDQCFSETTAVSGPGIHYTLHPVDLPNPKARFHPKLYILVGERAASIVVASANLTIYGCRSNFEVVDLLGLGASETPDRSAFRDCIGFLEAMSRLLPTGSDRIRQPLEDTQQALERLVTGTTGPDSGTRLLHTLQQPLIEQVVEQVPPDQVDEITVVSPFYDPRGRALRTLVDWYDRAQIRTILASADDANMDGASLVELEDRLGIEQAIFPNGDRRLHAKLYAFKGLERAWLLSGSANLSSAAWLKSAESGGNVEVVTLREVDVSVIEGLMAEVATRPLDFADLTHKPDDQDETLVAGAARFRLLHAIETDGRVEIVATGYSRSVGLSSFRVNVQGRGTPIHPTGIEITRDDDGLLQFRADFGSALETEGDGPLVVMIKSGVDKARIWMDRPHLLALSRSERAVRRTIAKLESGSFGDKGDFDAILGLISQYVSEISLPVAPNPAATSSDTGTRERKGNGAPQPSIGPASIDHLTVSMDEIPVDPTGYPTSARGLIQRAIRGFDRFLTVMSTAEDEAESGLPPGLGSDIDKGVEDGRPRRSSAWKLDALIEIDSAIDNVLDRVVATKVDVRFAANILELADILSRLAIHLHVHMLESDREPSGATELPRLLSRASRTFVETFSIRGSSQGTPRGWLVRAWLQDRTSVRETLLKTGRVESILSFLAASAVLSSSATTEAGEDDEAASDVMVSGRLTCVMAGILLMTGAEEPLSLLGDGMSQTSCAGGVQRLLGDRAREGEIHEALKRLAAAECSTLRTARWWGPLLALRQAEKQAAGPDQLGRLENGVRARSQRLFGYYKRVRSRGDDMIVRVLPDGEAASCGRCFQRLSLAKLQKLQTGEEPFAPCESCGAMLILIDLGSDAMRQILTEIDPELEPWLTS